MTVQMNHLSKQNRWLEAKIDSLQVLTRSKKLESLIPALAQNKNKLEQSEPMFDNPFSIEDLAVFDSSTLLKMLQNSMYGLTVLDLAIGLQGAPIQLVTKVVQSLPYLQRAIFIRHNQTPSTLTEVQAARQRILNKLFWELTYWKTPELYEELTTGEKLHPGIFANLQPYIQNKVILDAGAGSGRASFECVRHGAKQIFAVEPSPGLLNILDQKLAAQPVKNRIKPLQGRFDKLPLASHSVDLALACSAFTADSSQGGEVGLAELVRVTKPGGKVVIIWPRFEDYTWLEAHGFHYKAMPLHKEMQVHFGSLAAAWRCTQRFYAHNPALKKFLLLQRKAEVPFSLLGFTPPHDYCWLEVA